MYNVNSPNPTAIKVVGFFIVHASLRRPYTLDFTVHCPRDRGALYSMRLVFDRVPGCRPVALPCAGCEHAQEALICWRCRGAINEMFYRDPELPIHGGVVSGE